MRLLEEKMDLLVRICIDWRRGDRNYPIKCDSIANNSWEILIMGEHDERWMWRDFYVMKTLERFLYSVIPEGCNDDMNKFFEQAGTKSLVNGLWMVGLNEFQMEPLQRLNTN